MRPRSATRCVILLVASATWFPTVACRKATTPQAAPRPGCLRVGRLDISEVGYPARNARQVAPRDLPSYVDAIYRLKPDRRFIYALSEVHRILGGEIEQASVRHLDNGWVISLGGTEVGRLPDFPSFADGLALTRSWAAYEIQSMKGPSGQKADPGEVALLGETVWHGSSHDLWRVLGRVNELARRAPRDPALMNVAGEALLALRYRNLDSLDICDPVLGRVMALLALAEVVSGQPAASRTLSILASEMGYREDALDLATALDPADPWSHFLNLDSGHLRSLASSRDPFTVELALRSLAGRSDREGLWSLAESVGWDSPPRIEFLSAAVGLYDLGAAPQVNAMLLEAAFRMAVEARLPDTSPRKPSLLDRVRTGASRLTGGRTSGRIEGRLEEFEAAVSTQARRLDGIMVDEVTWSALLRAPLYSALFAQAHYLLDIYGSTPTAAEWAKSLVGPPAGTASELKGWVEHRVSARNGAPAGGEAITRDLGTLRQIGVWPVGRLITSVGFTSQPMWSPRTRQAVRGMLDGFDTRPEALAFSSSAARYILEDLGRFERFGAAALARSPGVLIEDSLTFLLRNTRDTTLLRRIADGRAVGWTARAAALRLLLDLGEEPPESVFARLRALVAESQDTPSLSPVQTLVSALDSRGLRVEADKAIDEWLASSGPNAGLAKAEVLAMKSARLRQAQRLADAWRTIEPAAVTGKESCLVEAAKVRLAQGQLDQAIAIARDITERYGPDGHGTVIAAEAQWKNGRLAEAATQLKTGMLGRSGSEWRGMVSQAFANAFAAADANAVQAAVQELVRAGVGGTELRALAEGLADVNQHLMASHVFGVLTGSDAEGRGAVLLTYRELRKAKGQEVALGWLRTRMTRLDDTSFIWAFSQGEDDLLWEFADETGPKPQLLNLLRAAAWARGVKRDPARRARIMDYCRQLNQKEWVAVFPQYLVGEKDENALFAAAPDQEGVSTAAWLVGLRKAGEGKLAEANDWFQAALETGTPGSPPAGLSYELMTKWCFSGYNLDGIAKQHLVF